MYGSKRLMAVSLVVMASLMSAVPPASAAGRTTRWVDGDGHAGPGGCNTSGHASVHIQTAVDASHAGDTVIVCPGTYVEQVTIKGHRKGLTLKSSKSFGASIKAPTSLSGPGGLNSLVLVDHVDNVTVRGFKVVARTLAPCEHVHFSILVVGSRHAAIRGNRLLAPGSSTPDCSQGDGIMVLDAREDAETPRSSSAMIGYNEVRDATELGIGVLVTRRWATVDIVHNSVRAYFGQPPAGGSSVTGITVDSAYGILTGGRVRGSIRSNVVQGAAPGSHSTPAFAYGIGVIGHIAATTSPFDNGPIDIHDNIIRRVLWGMVIQDAATVTVRNNRVGNTDFGIRLLDAVGGSVRRNTIASKVGGLVLDHASATNSLSDNTLSGAGSCDDESSGTGTAGTANHWSGNTATQSSNPPGICAVSP